MGIEAVHPFVSEFAKWQRRLGPNDRASVAARLKLLEDHGVLLGLPNVRRINDVLHELRTASGLRLYFVADDDLAVFVRYGNKTTQARDIPVATKRAQELIS